MRVGKDVQVDWKSFAEAIGPIRVIDNPAIRKAKSKDFYWYSPILKAQLDGHIADLVVMPKDRAELATVVAHAVARQVPVTLRGRGSGNYGQCVPLAGGVVIDLTGMKAIPLLSSAQSAWRLELLRSWGRLAGSLTRWCVIWRSSVQVANLVKHKNIPTLGVGLVTEILGVHCMVQWTYDPTDDRKNPGPTLEVAGELEIINESR